MTAPDTSPEAVEKLCTACLLTAEPPLSSDYAGHDLREAVAMLRALSGELAKANDSVRELLDDSARVAQDNIAVRGELARARARELLSEAPDWEPISTLDMSDDLIWLCRGDTVEGPRPPQVDDYDYWDWWCYAESPPLPGPDCADEASHG